VVTMLIASHAAFDAEDVLLLPLQVLSPVQPRTPVRYPDTYHGSSVHGPSVTVPDEQPYWLEPQIV